MNVIRNFSAMSSCLVVKCVVLSVFLFWGYSLVLKEFQLCYLKVLIRWRKGEN